ncbi:casA [Symbiodinium natans]|uniref:CasA protein n=1 Tax=Symbiodinium natans TaxID=878477 RepID=A0A812TPC2_9DINO|nr:casA [Symbiodinium natans]
MAQNERQRVRDLSQAPIESGDLVSPKVLFGLCGQGQLSWRKDLAPCPLVTGLDPNTRVSIATFIGYYQMLGASIERDRDFEDLLRHHWGFAEVPQLLDDMRGKFAMVSALCVAWRGRCQQCCEVGLAYAFRKHLE